MEQACAAMSAFSQDNKEVKDWFRCWFQKKQHVCRAYKSTAHREGIMKAAAYARQIESEQYSDVEPMDMPTDVVQ